jgi:hypothetical protein
VDRLRIQPCPWNGLIEVLASTPAIPTVGSQEEKNSKGGKYRYLREMRWMAMMVADRVWGGEESTLIVR